MKYSDTYREQLLLDAVRSAEDAAIQLRQYAAAVLEPAQTVPGDAFSDNSQASVVEITLEGWLVASLPGMMPRRDDADRSRFLAGLLRDAIRRTFPEHDQPKFHACVLVCILSSKNPWFCQSKFLGIATGNPW